MGKEEGLPGWVRYDNLPGQQRNVPFGTSVYEGRQREGYAFRKFPILCVCTDRVDARWYWSITPRDKTWEDFHRIPPGLNLKEMMQYVEVVARMA